jgi:glycosyltransferase involved in cell wall biosynthesis
MGDDIPVIAIVTINFNNLDGLINTLESVNIQKDTYFEHIIVDGASTDGSVEYLRNFNSSENIKVKIITEPDNGIYDAMNKGIKASNAKYIMFLNSGDCFVSEAVVWQNNFAILENDFPDVIFSNIIFGKTEKPTRVWRPGEMKRYKLFLGWMPPHPSTIVNSQLFERYGYFNTDFKIAADYDFLLKILVLNRVKSVYLDMLSVAQEPGGISNRNIFQILRANAEVIKSWRLNYSWTPFWIFLLKPLAKFLQLKF